MSYTLVNVDDPAVENFRDAFFKLRRALGTNAFGLNEIRLPPNMEGMEHDESETGHEEVYAVIDGDGAFTIDGEDVQVKAGDYLRVDPQATRIAKAGGNGLRFIVVAAKPQPSYDGRESL